mgnify:CR=1 FL=1
MCDTLKLTDSGIPPAGQARLAKLLEWIDADLQASQTDLSTALTLWRDDVVLCVSGCQPQKIRLPNVFVERLWRSVKYERVYLRAYGAVSEAKIDVAQYIDWYNCERVHSSIEDRPPEQAYWELLPKIAQAA